jgi:pilus assembly protein Flp/PilA
MSNLRRFVQDTRGANAMEYCILIGMIALIVFAGIKTFGSNLNTAINSQAGSISNINTSANH